MTKPILGAAALIAASLAQAYTFNLDTKQYPDGPVQLTALACDAAGNCTESTPVTLMVDNTPPTATISAPADGAQINGKVIIKATTADASACTHKLRIDGATVASGACGSIAYVWQTRHIKRGPHTIVVTATDAAGNTTAKQITVTV